MTAVHWAATPRGRLGKLPSQGILQPKFRKCVRLGEPYFSPTAPHPNTKPFPRTYVPQEITAFFSDPEATALSIAPAPSATRAPESTRTGIPANAGAPLRSTRASKERASKFKRTTTEPHASDKRYVRCDEQGQFTTDQTSVGKSLSADRRTHAKTVAPNGQGDRGDQKKA